MLDEPPEGIVPVLVDEMFELFARLKEGGMTILLVEQNVERALSISDRAHIMDHGVIVREAPAGPPPPDAGSGLDPDRAVRTVRTWKMTLGCLIQWVISTPPWYVARSRERKGVCPLTQVETA